MTTPESQERLKEAKAIQEKIEQIITDEHPGLRARRILMLIAGMLTETFLEYEEPDTVMEQAFHRIADMIRAEPAEVIEDDTLDFLPWAIDKNAEIGRTLAREAARRLPREMDDVHEIAIALVLSYFPQWEQNGENKPEMFRALIESVLSALTFEMAAQDFCDLIVEDFVSEGQPVQQALTGLAALGGYYLAEGMKQEDIAYPEGERELTYVMGREAFRHGTAGKKDWTCLGAGNDLKQDDVIAECMVRLREPIEEFFEMTDMEDGLGRAVCAAKAAGRMVAVATIEDDAPMQVAVAKSLARTGLLLGLKMAAAGNA